MMDLYKRMEAEGKIGRFYLDKSDGQLKARPFQEFPKTIRVKRPSGEVQEVIVNSAREELAAQSYDSGAGELDPVVKERNELLDMVAERDARAAADQQRMAHMQSEIQEMRKLMLARKPEPPAAKDDDEE